MAAGLMALEGCRFFTCCRESSRGCQPWKSETYLLLGRQRECGVTTPLRVAPLFETLDDLDHSESAMEQLLSNKWCAARAPAYIRLRVSLCCARVCWRVDAASTLNLQAGTENLPH